MIEHVGRLSGDRRLMLCKDDFISLIITASPGTGLLETSRSKCIDPRIRGE
jgi:hypothetical protein